jgi:uncharacterized protein YbjT (DUF2867 family)
MILVSGGTGNVGGAIVRSLVGAGLQVRVLTRGGGAVPPGADAFEGDLGSPQSLGPALDGVRALFLLAGYPGVADAAARADVEHVVLLSSGCVEGGNRENAVTRYNVEAEDEVRAAGPSWTILRPSGFMSNALRWLPQLEHGDVVRLPWAGVAISLIHPEDIAAVAAASLAQPGHEGRAYRLTGPEPLLPADQVRVVADITGRPLTFEAQSDEQARAEMEGSVPEPYIDAFFRFFSAGEYDDSQVTPTVEELLARPPLTLEAWAQANADAFRR